MPLSIKISFRFLCTHQVEFVHMFELYEEDMNSKQTIFILNFILSLYCFPTGKKIRGYYTFEII